MGSGRDRLSIGQNIGPERTTDDLLGRDRRGRVAVNEKSKTSQENESAILDIFSFLDEEIKKVMADVAGEVKKSREGNK